MNGLHTKIKVTLRYFLSLNLSFVNISVAKRLDHTLLPHLVYVIGGDAEAKPRGSRLVPLLRLCLDSVAMQSSSMSWVLAKMSFICCYSPKRNNENYSEFPTCMLCSSHSPQSNLVECDVVRSVGLDCGSYVPIGSKTQRGFM